MPELWDRQIGESRQAYASFAIYRDMGPSRSLDSAYCKSKGLERGAKVAPGSWQARCRNWSWVERAEAWDTEQDRITREEAADRIRKMHEGHAAIANIFISKVAQRVRTLDPNTLTPRDLSQWLDTAVKIERVARGAPAEILSQEHSGPGGGPINTRNAGEAMTKDELEAEIERISRKLGVANPLDGLDDPQ